MSPRAISPAISDNEFDITNSLLRDDSINQGEDLSSAGTKGSTIDANCIWGVESDDDGDEAFIAAQQAASNRKLKVKNVKKGGGFQTMGLNAHLLKAITRKGFSVPTPIQRKTIPVILNDQDVVGMARTGSGKTAAFVIPMIEKLKTHSVKVGARALILSPSRELALQTLKVVKELGRGTDLKCVLLVGGDSLEDQFGFMTGNPDVIIATPGRFLHLKVEMSLDLSSMRYAVFDEADRLFEMGFAVQLTEILHALPTQRQTLLFSATLPKSLVEFARAGLQEPRLIRLDIESKVSPDLESAFFNVKGAEKEGALLYILQDLIKMPTGIPRASTEDTDKQPKKRKRGQERPIPNHMPTEHSTIIFAATKHHVDYLAALLRVSGYAVSHSYGSLDQTARNIQVENFRTGLTNILVVTDVAARGIDIPILANVINYDFPPQPKVFVHRVGRTARAGERGWSYNLVRDTDVPYLLDLQLFLGKRLLLGQEGGDTSNYAEDMIVGSLARDRLERSTEWVSKLLGDHEEIATLRSVATKGERLYVKTRNSASAESAKRAKGIVSSRGWAGPHPLFNDLKNDSEQTRLDMLTRISNFRPQETVFEIGSKGKASNGEAAQVMRKRREKITPRRHKDEEAMEAGEAGRCGRLNYLEGGEIENNENMRATAIDDVKTNMNDPSSDEFEDTFSKPTLKSKDGAPWKDSENFLPYTPKTANVNEERGYGVHSGSYNTSGQKSSFVEAARDITMELSNDGTTKAFGQPSRTGGRYWDKKNKKYVARWNDNDGSKGAKMIRSESGQKIAASFQSGRYDKWRKAHRLIKLPKVGETEREGVGTRITGHSLGTRYKHKLELAPKEADKYRDDYHARKKRIEEAKEKRIGRFKDGLGKREIRNTNDIRKERKLAERRKAKNSRFRKNKR